MSRRAGRKRRQYFVATRAAVKTGAGIDKTFTVSNICQALALKIYAYRRLHDMFYTSPHMWAAGKPVVGDIDLQGGSQ
ncbi:hypothetical protein BGX30_012919 [Mortierella sp. GBA39]|nr:hypothetical protein BGX30_012919 [Mortierella sp. GBA39]